MSDTTSKTPTRPDMSALRTDPKSPGVLCLNATYLTELRAYIEWLEQTRWPLPLEATQEIVEHLVNDNTYDGLILGDRLNTAMGASARRRAEAGW